MYVSYRLIVLVLCVDYSIMSNLYLHMLDVLAKYLDVISKLMYSIRGTACLLFDVHLVICVIGKLSCG